VNDRVSDVWNFKKDGAECWTWQRQSLRHELIQESEKPFDKFEDCVADARRCGYDGSFSIATEPQRDKSGRLLRLRR
jgi:hypothetical protein